MPANPRKKISAETADSNCGQSANSTKQRSKRAADRDGDSQPTKKAKRARKAPKPSNEIKDEPPDANVEPETEAKPRLTTPDLEFDYDRSQLRDPRPTPGRVKRPRKEGWEVTEEWKQKFEIPKPVKPKGRLSAFQKDELFREESILDPSQSFHSLYICHRKGPEASPTYDSAGFALDWHKVNKWMKPTRYNKTAMIRGMERSIASAKSEEEQMFDIFFIDGKGPDHFEAKDYMKDQVSKDLGIPWHQIGVPELRQWEKKGFQKQNAAEWWHEPNAEERKRMLKMMEGSSLRKDL